MMKRLGLLAMGLSVMVGCRTADHTDRQPSDTEVIADRSTGERIDRQVPEDRDATRGSGRGTSYRPNVGADQAVAGLAFPTGDEATSALLVHQVMPRQVSRNQPFDFAYHVTNLTGGTLQNVAVMLESTANLELVASTPSPTQGAGGMVWAVGDLGPRETRVIRVRGIADELGRATNCISASYNNSLCFATEVVEPGLQLVKRATANSMICDPITFTFVVSNPGTGVARNVRIEDTMPEGVRTLDGQSRVSIDVGDLAPGESREYTVQAEATRTGTFRNDAFAVADGDLRAESGQTETAIVQPVLELVSECRDEQYLGRNATVDYTVTNVGDGTSENTVVRVTLPASAEVVRVSQGGVEGNNVVTFNVGALERGDSATVSVTLTSNQIGVVRTTAVAQGECAEMVEAECSINYDGIPAILLEVVDIDDPVEVGTETVYVIRVTNQGSRPDNNVRIRAVLPAQQEYVSATGISNVSLAGNELTTAPVASLAPGAVAEWQIRVRAVDVGNIRFFVEMTSDFLDEPVAETESTNLYR